MQVSLSRWTRRRARERVFSAVLDYARRGWPADPGAHPVPEGARACSCDRVGCPAPGAHPISPSWSLRATADEETLRRRWARHPDANVVLPTGRVFDVLDVPAAAGIAALAGLNGSRDVAGPVAAYGSERYLFFVATRGASLDEDEWWPCHLDAYPAGVPETRGLRWHCRDSYIIAPPSLLGSGEHVNWVRRPGDRPLPDPLVLLEPLTRACDQLAASP